MRLKDIILILLFTIFFSFLIFIAKNYFFGGLEKYELERIEEKYIDPVVITDNQPEQIEEAKVELDSPKEIKINYSYIPKSFGEENDLLNYRIAFDDFLNYDSIIKKITLLDIMLYKQKGDVRGKMQNKKVRLFGIYEMPIEEFLAVGIHEFAHFYDLYILKKEGGVDRSDYFYDISWLETTVIKSGLVQKDFVSGYAMTNKYEDFAESFTYFILHNNAFLSKASNSEIMARKYDFFETFIFNNNEFIEIIFDSSEEIKEYYRDTTKIGYSLENFLQYLKK